MKNAWFERISRRGPLWLLPLLLAAGMARFARRVLTLWKWKILGIQIGKSCHIGPGLRSSSPRQVIIGNAVVIGEGVRFASEIEGGRLAVGSDVEIGRGTVLDHSADLTIESGALVSEQVIIYTHDHGYDPRSEPKATPLVLKSGCWVGARATILPSVGTIGEGAIIGAGAIVVEDVQDGHIYVGPKGRQIKRRDYSEHVVN